MNYKPSDSTQKGLIPRGFSVAGCQPVARRVVGGRTRRPRGRHPPISARRHTAARLQTNYRLARAARGERGLWGPAPSPGSGGPARPRAGGGAESGGGAQWSSDGRSHLLGVRAAERWTPQPMGGGEGEGRPGRRGGGARGRGTRGEEGAGSQSGSIRFSHHPRRGSQQLGRREERQRSGYSASRRLSARRGPQAPGSRPPRRHDAQEEGEQWPRPAHAHSAARPSPEPREAQARRFLCSAGQGRLPNLRRAGGLAHGGLRAAFWNVRQLEEPGARFERGGGNPLTSRGRALFSRSDRPGARGHFCSRAVPTRPLLSPAGQLRRGGGEGGGKNTLRSRGWARFAPHRVFLAHFRFFSQSPRGGRRGCQL